MRTTTNTSHLRQIRVEREMTLDELARRSGTERSKLSRVERRYAKLTSAELARVAQALRVSPRRLRSFAD